MENMLKKVGRKCIIEPNQIPQKQVDTLAYLDRVLNFRPSLEGTNKTYYRQDYMYKYVDLKLNSEKENTIGSTDMCGSFVEMWETGVDISLRVFSFSMFPALDL